MEIQNRYTKKLLYIFASLLMAGCTFEANISSLPKHTLLPSNPPKKPVIQSPFYTEENWNGKIATLSEAPDLIYTYVYSPIKLETGASLRLGIDTVVTAHNAYIPLTQGVVFDSKTEASKLTVIQFSGTEQTLATDSQSPLSIRIGPREPYVAHWGSQECYVTVYSSTTLSYGRPTLAAAVNISSAGISATVNGASIMLPNQVIENDTHFYTRSASAIYRINKSTCTHETVEASLQSTSIPIVVGNKVYISFRRSNNNYIKIDGTTFGATSLIWNNKFGLGVDDNTINKNVDFKNLFLVDGNYIYFADIQGIKVLNTQSRVISTVAGPTAYQISGLYKLGSKILVAAYAANDQRHFFELNPNYVNDSTPVTVSYSSSLGAMNEFSDNNLFKVFNINLPVKSSERLYFSIEQDGTSKLAYIDSNAVLNTVENAPANVRYLQALESELYFYGDVGGKTFLHVMNSGNLDLQRVEFINEDNYLVPKKSVLNSLNSNAAEMGDFLYSPLKIQGHVYVLIKGQRYLEFKNLEIDGGVTGAQGKLSQFSGPLKIPYALGSDSKLSSESTRSMLNYQKVAVYNGQDLYKIFSSNGYQIYLHEKGSLTPLTDIPGGVGLYAPALEYVDGDTLYLSNAKYPHGQKVTQGRLYKVDLKTRTTTEILHNGVPFSQVRALIKYPLAKYKFTFQAYGDGNDSKLFGFVNDLDIQEIAITTDVIGKNVYNMVADVFNPLPMDNKGRVYYYKLSEGSTTDLDLWCIDTAEGSVHHLLKPNYASYYRWAYDFNSLNTNPGSSYMFAVKGQMEPVEFYYVGDKTYIRLYARDNGLIPGNLLAQTMMNIYEITDDFNAVEVLSKLTTFSMQSGRVFTRLLDETFKSVDLNTGVVSTVNIPPMFLAFLNIDALTNNLGDRFEYSFAGGYFVNGKYYYTSVKGHKVDTQIMSFDLYLNEMSQTADGTVVLKEFIKLESAADLVSESYTADQAARLILGKFLYSTYSEKLLFNRFVDENTLMWSRTKASGSSSIEIVTRDLSSGTETAFEVPFVEIPFDGQAVKYIPGLVGFLDVQGFESLSKNGVILNGLPYEGILLYTLYLSTDTDNGAPTMYGDFGYFKDSKITLLTRTAVGTNTLLSLILNPNCFIATAALGSNLNSHIDVLRKFRNDVLMKFPLGRAFVRAYYEKAPAIAMKVYQDPHLKVAVRLALVPVLAVVYLFYHLFEALLLVGVVLVVRRVSRL